MRFYELFHREPKCTSGVAVNGVYTRANLVRTIGRKWDFRGAPLRQA